MKLIESFKRLSMPMRILIIALASPLLIVSALLALGVSSWLIAIFALPIIGFGLSRNSWRAGKTKSDKRVFVIFALSLTASVVLMLVLRQPQFRTDWEGGNPLDDQIMLLLLSTMLSLAATWGLAGWVGHRFVMNLRARRGKSEKQNRVAAPE
jgi:hypothetical protein